MPFPSSPVQPTPAYNSNNSHAQIQVYRDRPQLLGVQGVSWLLVRKKKDARQAFQQWLPGEGTGNGDDQNVEDLEPDEESPPSGPDAGGGKADSMLPSTEWEVQASSVNYTLSQVDQDRYGYAHFCCVVAHFSIYWRFSYGGHG